MNDTDRIRNLECRINVLEEEFENSKRILTELNKYTRKIRSLESEETNKILDLICDQCEGPDGFWSVCRIYGDGGRITLEELVEYNKYCCYDSNTELLCSSCKYMIETLKMLLEADTSLSDIYIVLSTPRTIE